MPEHKVTGPWWGSWIEAGVKKIPGALPVYSALRRMYLKRSSPERIFRGIFRGNKWDSRESVSGRGSELSQTRLLIDALPALLRDLQVKQILDIPCGDFNWMSRVPLDQVEYLGADIVGELIERNRIRHARRGLSFERLDLITDKLPRADLVLCRDCLVHLSFVDAFKALRNVCRSGSTWLLTTTYPSRSSNANILTGGWRTLNLEAPPFLLPKPVRVINEGCTQSRGAYHDKSLGLWGVESVAKAVSCFPQFVQL